MCLPKYLECPTEHEQNDDCTINFALSSSSCFSESNPISTIHVCVTVWGKSECPPNNYDQCRGYHQTIIISTVHFHQTHFNTHSLQATEPIHSTTQSNRCFYTSCKFTCSSSLSWITAGANHVTISMQMGQLWRYRSWLIIVPYCQQVQWIK